MAERVERGEIRLYHFPPPDKQRPVLVMTRESASLPELADRGPCHFGNPRVPSDVRLDVDDGMKQPCAVNLHNLVTVSKRALGRRLARLDQRKMAEVCRAAAFALQCDDD